MANGQPDISLRGAKSTLPEVALIGDGERPLSTVVAHAAEFINLVHLKHIPRPEAQNLCLLVHEETATFHVREQLAGRDPNVIVDHAAVGPHAPLRNSFLCSDEFAQAPVCHVDREPEGRWDWSEFVHGGIKWSRMHVLTLSARVCVFG